MDIEYPIAFRWENDYPVIKYALYTERHKRIYYTVNNETGEWVIKPQDEQCKNPPDAEYRLGHYPEDRIPAKIFWKVFLA
jgi:hypothetical protein